MRLTTLSHVDTTHDPAGASMLSFRTERPLRYKAGQFAVWFCGGALRPFTIASAPGDEFIQLGTRLHDRSAIKRALAALRPGDQARVLAPFGNVAPPDDGRPVVFAAQSIGVTVARSLLHEPAARRRALIHVGAPYFREELAALADTAAYPADRAEFAAAVGDTARSTPDAHWVITGSTPFVKATAGKLRSTGIASARLHTDGFLDLPDRDTV